MGLIDEALSYGFFVLPMAAGFVVCEPLALGTGATDPVAVGVAPVPCWAPGALAVEP